MKRPDEIVNAAAAIRRQVLMGLAAAGSGHTGGSLGLADIFACLYFSEMNHRPADPFYRYRDRLILSIGHVAPVLYASLACSGYFPAEEMLSLRKFGSRLQGHPGRDHGLPGIELSAGSLGQGLSVSVGLALAAGLARESYRIFCVMGDGELQEGSVWEAAMSAAHHRLSNLVAIVDRNGLQIDGTTTSVMEIEPLSEKWEAFGWKAYSCNGNDVVDILRCFDEVRAGANHPSVIIARTKMGCGVKSIENDCRWHGKAPSKDELNDFLQQLESHPL